jgi:hypothetical protein
MTTMIVMCAYCGRQRVDSTWIDALPPPPGEMVSHGMCSACYRRVMVEWGYEEAEIAADLEEDR